MKFGEYENSEQLLQYLPQYIFDKNYDHDTMDLVLEALSKIYMHRIFIFENWVDNPPCAVIGEKLPNAYMWIHPHWERVSPAFQETYPQRKYPHHLHLLEVTRLASTEYEI